LVRKDSDQSSTQTADGNLYQALFDNSPDAILIVKDSKFVECNQSAIDMLGFLDMDELLQSHPSDISPEYQPDGQTSLDKANKIMANASSQHRQRFEWVHLRADGGSLRRLSSSITKPLNYCIKQLYDPVNDPTTDNLYSKYS
jgi:PAS domain S-box-containing protein|tara:strand:- start:50 stop:478 length:429 start_codon:yes stop_codon:yes gene_type:complete